MTAPERILIGEEGGAGWRYGYWVLPGPDFKGMPEYIRADLLDAHIGAVLAEAAMISGFYSRKAERIRALRPDALQALERVRREAWVEGMQAAQASALARYHAGGDLLGVVNELSDMIAAEKEGKQK